MSRGWLLVGAVLVVGAVASWRAEKNELAQPGTPEYEAFFQEMLRDCVSESIQKDRAEKNSVVPPMTTREHEALCRVAQTKTLDKYPGVRPIRKVPN
jgi:hypothetical protein